MALDVPLLRGSFEIVLTRNPSLTARFYQILFERYPQAKPLFRRNTTKQQETMLAHALVAVMDHVEDAPWLQQTLAALGAKHVGYGVTREMYDWGWRRTPRRNGGSGWKGLEPKTGGAVDGGLRRDRLDDAARASVSTSGVSLRCSGCRTSSLSA